MSDRYSAWLYESSSYNFYERICNPDLINCWAGAEVEWSERVLARYMGSSFRTISNLTVDECKLACMQAKENFRCISIDYVRQDGYCYLNGRST